MSPDKAESPPITRRARAAGGLATVLALLVSSASGQSLSTTFEGGGAARGLMFDITALHPPGITVTGISINFPLGTMNGYTVRVWGRFESYVGHTESAAGWGYLGGSGSSAGTPPGPPFFVPYGAYDALHIDPGQTFAFYIECTADQGFTPIPTAQATYGNADIQIHGGVGKGPGGFTGPTIQDAMINCEITYIPTAPEPDCFANCDRSTTPPVLNILDFACFIDQFAARGFRMNCDHSTDPPFLNILDFLCFINAFAAGCS